MTQLEFETLAEEYERQTCFHSLPAPMRHTPAYAKMMEAGEQIIPWIIAGFQNHLREASQKGCNTGKYFPENVVPHLRCWGMTWVLLLMDLTKHTPIQPKSVAGGHMVAWSVNDTCKAWIDWYQPSADLTATN